MQWREYSKEAAESREIEGAALGVGKSDFLAYSGVFLTDFNPLFAPF